jgi:hypothetical protein
MRYYFLKTNPKPYFLNFKQNFCDEKFLCSYWNLNILFMQ